jgi:hypothetical protein
MPVTSAPYEVETRRVMVQGQPGQNKLRPPSEKQTERKRTSVITQVVEHLLSMLEALSSKPSTRKKT